MMESNFSHQVNGRAYVWKSNQGRSMKVEKPKDQVPEDALL